MATSKNKLQEQKIATWSANDKLPGPDQNGNNTYVDGLYDSEGRVVGSKAGIITVPAEMTPRQRLVNKKESVAKAYQPVAEKVDGLKSFIAEKNGLDIEANKKRPASTRTLKKY